MARYISILNDSDGRYYNDRDVEGDNDQDALARSQKKWQNSRYKTYGVIAEDAAKKTGWSHQMPRAKFDAWIKQNLQNFYAGEARNPADIQGTPAPAGPRKPKPVICPEVWRQKPEADTTDYMAAVRDMCKGVR